MNYIIQTNETTQNILIIQVRIKNINDLVRRCFMIYEIFAKMRVK